MCGSRHARLGAVNAKSRRMQAIVELATRLAPGPADTRFHRAPASRPNPASRHSAMRRAPWSRPPGRPRHARSLPARSRTGLGAGMRGVASRSHRPSAECRASCWPNCAPRADDARDAERRRSRIQRAGSTDVIALHGSISRTICSVTKLEITADWLAANPGEPPRSPHHADGLRGPAWSGSASTCRPEALDRANDAHAPATSCSRSAPRHWSIPPPGCRHSLNATAPGSPRSTRNRRRSPEADLVLAHPAGQPCPRCWPEGRMKRYGSPAAQAL